MNKSWFTVHRVHPNVYALAEFSHWEQVISYLVVDKTRAFLIDTGMGYESMYETVKKITSNPVTILLSHTHWDHIGGIEQFENLFVSNHKFELANLQKGFVSDTIPELTNESYFLHGHKPKKYSVKGRKNIHTFNHRQDIISDTFTITCIHTPGHTPGSYCFFIKKFGALFTGDTLYPAPLYAYLPESNWKEYVQSVQDLEEFVSITQHVYSGHNSIQENNSFLREVITDFKRIPSLMNKHTKKELMFDTFSFIWRE